MLHHVKKKAAGSLKMAPALGPSKKSATKAMRVAPALTPGQHQTIGRHFGNVVHAGSADRPQAPGAAVPAVGPELPQALTAARERGRNRIAEITDRPEMLSAGEFARLLGTTRVTVNTWRQKRQVLALDGATRGFRFPEWQIGEDGKPFAALPALFERLGGSPWAVYRFLVQHHPELGKRAARDVLRAGGAAAVLKAAENAGRTFG
jgi:hypothetical protein